MSTLTLTGTASLAGMLVHEYSHIAAYTADRKLYGCNKLRAVALGKLPSVDPGMGADIADTYRCWAEDTYVGKFGLTF
jgi:hypothetical protein